MIKKHPKNDQKMIKKWSKNDQKIANLQKTPKKVAKKGRFCVDFGVRGMCRRLTLISLQKMHFCTPQKTPPKTPQKRVKKGSKTPQKHPKMT